MPRALTIQAIREAQKEHGTVPFLVLLTIVTMPEAANINIVNNTEDIVSRGVTFIGCPFSLALPDSTDHTVESAEITVDNVDTRIWQGVRSLLRPIEIILEVIMADTPDQVLISTTGLVLREASANDKTISGKLVVDTVWQMGYPAHDFDPSQNPGMFVT